ncbi:MAG TPA: SUMF1/EgtB/PvdO family nonheme iron enzyme [Methylomirabilota bacterium]|nr:SUMF1/EgtB/PvdO family nonheme iron enzyme [Methylomirabilota bacterium]
MKPAMRLSAAVVTILGSAVAYGQGAKVDFVKDIKPILQAHCLSCHGPEKPKGDLDLSTRAAAVKGGDGGTSLVAGEPDKSPLYTLTILPHDHDDIMPPKGEKLTKVQTDLLKNWIQQGAEWPESEKLVQVKRIDFVRDIQPILETSCVACHKEGHDEGGLRIDTEELALKSGDSGPSIIPGRASESSFWKLTVLPADHDDLMPPKSKGGPLPKEQTDLIKEWIDQGALWPDGVKLVQKAKAAVAGGESPELVKSIHDFIVKTSGQDKPGAAYKQLIPGTEVSFEMLPIPGGEYTIGSPSSEAGRKEDEGPQKKIKIEPFWMGKTEITWNEYELFQFPDQEKKIRERRSLKGINDPVADLVTRPTTPYVEMSFGMGKDGYPAISMTQHAANTYCKWLSAKTGQFYRLPTEAEWEYACRAGTTTAFSFGDDPEKLGEHAWFVGNSEFKYQKVGVKAPNPWGLHDMHGNVAEWCLDQYLPDAYQKFTEAVTTTPWQKATQPYPHVVRGGSWNDDPELLRSAARNASDPSWKMQDPQLPKSIWYLTDAQFLGFRVVRPVKIPTAEEMAKYWTSGTEKD